MMDRVHYIFVRDDSTSGDDTLTPAMVNLLIALLVLVLVGLLLLVGLFVLRSHRRSRRDAGELPLYNEKRSSSGSQHRRLTVTATPYGRHSQSVFVYNEKQALVDDSTSPPPSPNSIPEIRITFPEEEDEAGRRRSGRVVVVRVSDTGTVGLEPCEDQGLPPYQSSDAQRFQSVDLERVGGLKEKAGEQRWS
ncbi:MAG: hypothetical protein M4579_003632 [Chaenotheca gracillima]|nr:MAG: hypothetical protein M4579_003632 [Chaenotheca gracillima]